MQFFRSNKVSAEFEYSTTPECGGIRGYLEYVKFNMKTSMPIVSTCYSLYSRAKRVTQ